MLRKGRTYLILTLTFFLFMLFFLPAAGAEEEELFPPFLQNTLIVGDTAFSIGFIRDFRSEAAMHINQALVADGGETIIINLPGQVMDVRTREMPTAIQVSSILEKLVGYWDKYGGFVFIGPCSDYVIDFEDLRTGTHVLDHYSPLGVTFGFGAHIRVPADVEARSGTKVVRQNQPVDGPRHPLIIEFDSLQSCVSMYVGLIFDMQVVDTFKLEAFGPETVLPGGTTIPGIKVAEHEVYIGPGRTDINKWMRVQTEGAQIKSVRLSSFHPVIDDLSFSTLQE